MKKRLCVVLACMALAVLGFCACGERQNKDENNNMDDNWKNEAVDNTVTPTATPVAIADISSAKLVEGMKIGWNLGNSLDARGGTGIMSEFSWGNPRTTKEMIDEILAAGFNVIRIPVTWDGHFGTAPEYKINEIWLERVKEVVDYAYEQGAYIILNTHHEDWYLPTAENREANAAQLAALWTQIAVHFENYDERLIFEGLNEPRLRETAQEWTQDKEASEIINEWEQVFVDAVRATGGNNKLRHLMITGYAASSARTNLEQIVLPNDDKLIISVHAYIPYSFAMDGKGTSTWETQADAGGIDALMETLDELFVSKGTPVIIGEFGAVNKENEEERAEWAAYYLAKAGEIGVPCIWWDNNAFYGSQESFGLFSRQKLSFEYPHLLAVMMRVVYPE